MEFRILGSLEVFAAAAPLPLGGPLQRSLLAVLVAHPNRTVSVSRLVDAVWDEAPPATAERQIRNMIGLLRRTLGSRHGPRSPIVTDGAGYRLVADEDAVDHCVFGARVAAAESETGARAVSLLRGALELWRGPALDGLPGRAFAALAAGLEEQRLAAIERLYELELEAGRHHEVTAELTRLVSEFPLRDRLVRYLLTALHRSGRNGDGLEVYRHHASRLAEDLGLDPTPEARALQQTLLDPSPSPPAAAAPRPGPAAASPAPRPAQLPAALPVFVGRMPELAALDEVLAPLAGPGVGPAAAPIAVVTGAAGVGKTALALHWAHRHHEDFPDGQLYADLRGWSALGPQAPEVVMAAFLRALGVTTELPSHLDEASGLYRSLLAERRVLVVLDDAVSPEQLRPLLPGGAGCAVLVTSRDRLTGLAVREGARRIPLGGFTSAEGRTLLAHVLGGGAADGADSTEAQRRAGTLLLNACGHLPLAVGIAAAQLRDRPQPDLAAFAVELSTSADRLSALEVGDDRSSLRSAFELSYRALDPAARHLFRRLGLFPGVDIGRAVAAALTGRTEEECDRLLRRLAAANLLIERSSGSYRFHDLLRLFAAESGTREESPAEQRRVLDRWYAWCLHHADRAARVLTPGRRRAPLDPPPGGLDLAVFADPAQATRWCDGQRANLVATVHRAYARGDDEVAWKLPALLWSYLHRSEPQVERVALGQAAVAAAGWLGDLSAHAHGLNDLAQAWSALGELELSRETLQQAEPVAREAGDRCAEGRILIGLGAYHFFGGRYAEARTYYERALALLISDGPGGDGPGTDGPGTDGPGGDGPGTDGPGTDGPESDGPGGDGQDADAWTIDLCRVSLIATHVRLGGYHEARELASSALAHPRAQPNGPVDCALLTNLAAACHGLGRPDEAVTYYERSLGVSSDLPGYPAQRAHALAGLAAAHHALGQTEASRSYRDDAREIYAELPAHQMASILPILRALGYPDLAGDEHER